MDILNQLIMAYISRRIKVIDRQGHQIGHAHNSFSDRQTGGCDNPLHSLLYIRGHCVLADNSIASLSTVDLQLLKNQISDTIVRNFDFNDNYLTRPDFEMFANDQKVVDTNDTCHRLEYSLLNSHHTEFAANPLAAGDGPGLTAPRHCRNQHNADTPLA